MWWRWGKRQNFFLAVIDELWKAQKIRLLKKWKKLQEISSFYTCVPKTTIIWRTAPNIRSETEFFVILGHFLPFYHPLSPPSFLLFCPNINAGNQNLEKNVKNTWRYYPFTHVCHKSRSHDVWFLRYEVQQKEFFCHPKLFFSLLFP